MCREGNEDPREDLDMLSICFLIGLVLKSVSWQAHELATLPHPLEISSNSETYVRPIGQSPAIKRTPLNWRLPAGNAMLISAENILRITNYFKNATLPWYLKPMGGGSCSWDSNEVSRLYAFIFLFSVCASFETQGENHHIRRGSLLFCLASS